MEKIGKLLRAKRLEQGFTIADVSEKTRLTTKNIQAIEEGDISYFKDDLSYLRFFLKSYCDMLNLDFEPIKEELRTSIDDFAMTSTQQSVFEHKEMERSIQETSRRLKQSAAVSEASKETKEVVKKEKVKKEKPKKVKQRRKIDVSLLSFLSIVLVVAIGLIFAFVMWMQRDKEDNNGLANNVPPVHENENPQEDPKDPVTPPKEEETKDMKITAVNETQFTVENLAIGSEIDVEITFGANTRTSFRALVNGAILSNPANQVYNPKEVVHVRQNVSKDMVIQLAFGYMVDNQILINGVKLELPTSITSKQGSAVVQLDIKGE